VRMLRRKLLRDLRRQPAQAAAIALMLFLGTALFGASYDAYRNLDASYARVFDELAAADLYVKGGRTSAYAAAAARTAGVAAVATRVEADLPLEARGERLLGRVVGVPPRGQPTVNRLLLRSGSALDPSRPSGVLVERHLAEHFRLRPGDRLRALGPEGWRSLTVRGVVDSAEYLWPARSRQDVLPPPGSFGVVFAPEPLAASLAGLTQANEALVRHGPGGGAALTHRLAELAARFGAVETTTRADQASNAALRTDIDGFRELAIMFPLLFLGAAALATGVLLSRRVRSERGLIGTLRANGARRGQVVAHYLGAPIDLFQRIIINTASITMLNLGQSHPTLVKLNDTGSLGP